jgi:hypothetical protein
MWRANLPPRSRISRLDLNAFACTARALACAGRILLVSSALSLLTMPITEHLWNWDRFLQTGRDFELGTLMLLTFLCLVLVLSRQWKQAVEFLFSEGRILAFPFSQGEAPVCWLQMQPLQMEPELSTGAFGLPLQI